MNFKYYTNSNDYENIYDHNFNTVNSINEDKLYTDLIKHLGKTTGLDRHLIMIDLKRYLMMCSEYYTKHFSYNPLYYFLVPYFMVYMLMKKFKKCTELAEIIIDEWSPGCLNAFYGEELLNELSVRHKCLYIKDYRNLGTSNIFSGFRYLLPMLKSMHLAGKIRKRYSIDLRRYVFTFFRDFLTGQTLKKNTKPKWFISGNDNGFAFIIAKAAGAKLMLIQNAKRLIISDSSFKYADCFISLEGATKLTLALKHTGSDFKKIYYLGSLRLYYVLKKNPFPDNIHNNYDILWVSTFPPRTWNDGPWAKMYPMEADMRAIRLLNRLAENNTDLRIVYQCASENEIEELEELGLRSQHILYLPREGLNVYNTILQSSLVLSGWSTTCTEAMKIGKKVGFHNLSGNKYINYGYETLAIEYNLDSMWSFEDFLKNITEQKRDYGDFAVQSPTLVSDIVSIIEENSQS